MKTHSKAVEAARAKCVLSQACAHVYTPMSPGSSKVVACRLCHARLLGASVMQAVGSYCHVVPCHLCCASSMQAGGCQSQCLGGHWASGTSPPDSVPSVGGAHCIAFWMVPIALPSGWCPLHCLAGAWAWGFRPSVSLPSVPIQPAKTHLPLGQQRPALSCALGQKSERTIYRLVFCKVS